MEGEGVKSPEGGAGTALSARGAPPTTRDDAGWARKREAPLGWGSSLKGYILYLLRSLLTVSWD
ncbi:MAG: hypothetical protein RXR16_02645 [Thermocladium sp.]